jgi:serine/threonine-protein kinase HipA
MARRPTHRPLNVFMNNQFVGTLEKEPSGAISFRYDQAWLARDYALPVSLSMPLSDAPHRGAVVRSVFENLLPDRDSIRRRVAERVGAEDTDAYSLLAKIGRDCVGALQFVPDDEAPTAEVGIHAEDVSDADIERILANLAHAPLGLNAEDEFRISVAGAQEKTALLWHEGRWKRPIGGTPTTHILKPQIGNIETSTGTIDLNNSVENEYYCLKLMSAFGLTVTNAEIAEFGDKKALVIERFDRQWTRDGRLLRLPQEDCCQALSVPPGQKYQNHGGPGITEIMRLLRDGDTPQADQIAFFKSQVLFWLIGATDGHAKNFSIFLKPGGRYALTPLYDVLTAQPSFDAKQIPHKYYKLAMSVGNSRHYDILGIRGRHFVETAREAGLGATLLERIIDDVVTTSDGVFEKVEDILPRGFDASIHESVKAAFTQRVKLLR